MTGFHEKTMDLLIDAQSLSEHPPKSGLRFITFGKCTWKVLVWEYQKYMYVSDRCTYALHLLVARSDYINFWGQKSYTKDWILAFMRFRLVLLHLFNYYILKGV